MRQLYADGQVDFRLTDADYLNPWQSTRAVTVWFDVMLDEADGDLDMAIRAYHVGIEDAQSGQRQGVEYAANVVRKRRRFLGDAGAPPSWHVLFTRFLRPPR